MQGSTMKAAAYKCGLPLLRASSWCSLSPGRHPLTRPEPIRIAFANSLSGRPPRPDGKLVATQLAIDE